MCGSPGRILSMDFFGFPDENKLKTSGLIHLEGINLVLGETWELYPILGLNPNMQSNHEHYVFHFFLLFLLLSLTNCQLESFSEENHRERRDGKLQVWNRGCFREVSQMNIKYLPFFYENSSRKCDSD